MYVQQSLTEDSWLAYLKPFNEFVWFAMLSWMALVAVMSYVFEQFTSEKKGFLNSIVFLVFQLLKVSQMLCNQGRCLIYFSRFTLIYFFLKNDWSV